jgi:hypothetical protein
MHGCEHQPDVVGGAPVADGGLAAWGEVVTDHVEPPGRESASQLTQELEELLAALAITRDGWTAAEELIGAVGLPAGASRKARRCSMMSL